MITIVSIQIQPRFPTPWFIGYCVYHPFGQSFTGIWNIIFFFFFHCEINIKRLILLCALSCHWISGYDHSLITLELNNIFGVLFCLWIGTFQLALVLLAWKTGHWETDQLYFEAFLLLTFILIFHINWGLEAQLVKNPPAMQETWVWSLSCEDPLEKGKATHSRILA